MKAEEAFENISKFLIKNESMVYKKWPTHNLTYSMGHGYPLDEDARFDVYLIESGGDARVMVGDGRSDKFLFQKDLMSGEVDETILPAWNFISNLK